MLGDKKILLVHSSSDLYGSDRCLIGIVKGIVDQGAEPHVAVPSAGPLVEELSRLGVQVHILDTCVFRRNILSLGGFAHLVLRAPVSIFRLAYLMQREKFDLVHTNTGVTLGGAIAAKLTGTPHIWHFRELLNEFGFFLKLYQPLVVLLSNRIIFITGAVRGQFGQEAREIGSVIHDGIPVHDYEVKEKISSGRFVVATVGRLAPYKGQDVLLQALARVKEAGVDLEAYIVGDVYADRHGHRHSLMTLARQLSLQDQVHFTGFKKQIQPYLQKCDVFVMPSIRPEGLGIVMLEAMAASRAVIAADGGGVREVITDGKVGLLVPPGDSKRMAEAIIRLAKDEKERNRLARNGEKKAKGEFSQGRMVDAVMDLYDEVISSRPGRASDGHTAEPGRIKP